MVSPHALSESTLRSCSQNLTAHFCSQNLTVFTGKSNVKDWHGHNLIVVEINGNCSGNHHLVVDYLKKIEKQATNQNKTNKQTKRLVYLVKLSWYFNYRESMGNQ